MDLIINTLLGFAMVLTRISAFFLVIPVFSWRTIPARVKVALAVLLSLFFVSVKSSVLPAGEVEPLEAGLYLVNEGIYGFGLGLIVVLIFSAVKVSGRIIERQMGLAMASTLDPLTGERSKPLSMLMEIIFILIFLAADGHHIFIMIISRSYESFPAGSIPSIESLTDGVVQAGSTMLIAGLRLAAPMLAAFFLLLVVLAVFARIMPNMNILFISMPLRAGLGLLMVGIFLPFIQGFVSEFADWMGKLLPL